MLKDRILSTLNFFDLQDTPLTLFELWRFLMADLEFLMPHLDQNWELRDTTVDYKPEQVSIGEILNCLDTECAGMVECRNGYYCLKGRVSLIAQRLENYQYGIRREKLIRSYISGVRHVPFVRGVGLVGSQPLGAQKPGSDIDLLILVAPGFMWLARIFITAYFQILGRRRHGKKVANRFCLNHYLIAGKALSFDRNLYTAAEYLKMRPLAYGAGLREFSLKNEQWMRLVFPNAETSRGIQSRRPSIYQKAGERLLNNSFGRWLEQKIRIPQYKRINAGEFIVAADDELSFHPNNRKKELFRKFFQARQEKVAV